MSFNIKHINKYIRWAKNLNKQYETNCKIGKDYAKFCGNASIASLLGNHSKEKQWMQKKNDWVLNQVRLACPETIEKYKNIETPSNLYKPQEDIKIWSMWWQGEKNADKLFRMCIESARKHLKHPVVVLDKDNYTDYFELPDYILNKFNEGKIQIQHICDLMFVSILANQGGFFTGATVYWAQDGGDKLLKSPLFTPRAVDLNATAPSKFRWTGYLMAGNKEFPLFQFAKDALYEYWKNSDKAVDYLLMDYIFELAYEEIPCVKELIDSLPEKNNMLRNELIEDLSTPYDENIFKKYTEGDTLFYKLSWKFGKKDEITSDGKFTNYGHMLKELNLD